MDIQLLQDILGAGKLVENEQNIPRINTDHPVVLLLKQIISSYPVPVCVEGTADQLSPAVDDRASGVSSGNIHVCNKTDRHILQKRIGIAPEVFVLPKVPQ